MSFLSLFDFLNKKVEDATMEEALQKIITQLALKELAISIAISYIAGAISKSEIKVYEDLKSVKDEWYYRLNYNPNDNENASQFWHKVIDKVIRNGDGALIIFDKNKKMYCADSFHKEEIPLGENKFTDIAIGGKSLSKKTYKAGDVLHFKLEDRCIKKCVDDMYKDYGEAFDYAMNYFKIASSKKYRLKIDSTKAGNSDFNKDYEEKTKKQLEAFLKPGNIVYPQYRYYDLEDMSSNNKPDAANIVALRKDIFESVATAFKIPAVMFTGNITNIHDVVTTFITFGVDPLATMVTKELTRKTNDFSAWAKGSYVKVDTSKIEHIDIFSKAENIDKLIACGVYSVDELREKLEDMKLNTSFSQKHFITKNYIELEKAAKGGE